MQGQFSAKHHVAVEAVSALLALRRHRLDRPVLHALLPEVGDGARRVGRRRHPGRTPAHRSRRMGPGRALRRGRGLVYSFLNHGTTGADLGGAGHAAALAVAMVFGFWVLLQELGRSPWPPPGAPRPMIKDIQDLWNGLIDADRPDHRARLGRWSSAGCPTSSALLVLRRPGLPASCAGRRTACGPPRACRPASRPLRRRRARHLPGPSPWPFVAPVGAAIMLLGLVWKTGRVGPRRSTPTTGARSSWARSPARPSSFNLPVLLLGLLVVVVGIIGWYRDARH